MAAISWRKALAALAVVAVALGCGHHDVAHVAPDASAPVAVVDADGSGPSPHRFGAVIPWSGGDLCTGTGPSSPQVCGITGIATSASTGVIRLANNTGIYARNAANSNDIIVAGTDSSNDVIIGNSQAASVAAFASGGAELGVLSGTVLIANAQNLHWNTQGDSPLIDQATQANASNPHSIMVAPQAPGASCTNATNCTPGSLVLNESAPGSGGSEGGYFLQRGGTSVGAWVSPNAAFGFTAGTASAVYLGNATYSTTNFFAQGTGVNNFLNASTEIAIGIGGTLGNSMDLQAAGVQFFARTQSLGGGSGVIGITAATTDPATNPSGAGILYESNSGNNLRHRGSGGALIQLAGSGGGTVNTQKLIDRDKEGWVVRTTSTSATTVYTSGSVASSHVTTMIAYCQSIDTTALAASSSAAGIACSYVNSAGTVSQIGATTTLYNHNYTTAPSCAISGTTLLVQVTAKTTDTTDTQCFVREIQD